MAITGALRPHFRPDLQCEISGRFAGSHDGIHLAPVIFDAQPVFEIGAIAGSLEMRQIQIFHVNHHVAGQIRCQNLLQAGT